MEINELSPAENDVALAKILNQIDEKYRVIANSDRTIESEYVSESKKAFARVARSTAKLDIAELHSEAIPYETHYAAQGWQRYYLVTNGNGHVHTSTACSTCFITTEFAWLPECSGMTETELVEEFGERVCTVCCPSAPVVKGLVGRRDRETQDAKAAEKAEKLAAKLVKAILPDGSELKLQGWATNPKTLIAAQRTLSSETESLEWYGETHPSASEWKANIETLLVAIANKTGRSPEVIRAEVNTKVAKKVAKEKS